MTQLGILWLVVFISLLGFGVTTVPFPLVAEQMGASHFWITFGNAGVFSLAQLLALPFWGKWSDKVGRKPVLVISLAGSVVAYLWTAYAGSIGSLVAARALGGISSGNLAAAFAYATDISDVKTRARSIGIVSSAFGVGFAIGPVIGGYLGRLPDGGASLHWPGLTSAALALIAMLGTMWFLPESLPAAARAAKRDQAVRPRSDGHRARRRGRLTMLDHQPALMGLFFAALVVSLGSAAMQSIFQIWGRDQFAITLDDVGIMFGLFAGLSAVGQAILTGVLVKRLGEKKVALIATGGVTIGLAIFSVASSVGMIWGALVIYGLSLGIFTPAVTSLVSLETEATNRGAVMGVFNSFGSLGRVLGPGISGPSYYNIGVAAPFVISGVMTLIGAALLTRVHPELHEERHS